MKPSPVPLEGEEKEMLNKLFGGIRMTWSRLILFAVISGVITALIAILVPEGNSIRQVAVTFEVWIVLAIIIVVNCEKPLEAACKTFVFFLISQPLIYLIQVPFSSMGWKLFGYYTYWFCWTAATFPGAFSPGISNGTTGSGRSFMLSPWLRWSGLASDICSN